MIILKYEENFSSNKKKFSTGLVITISLAILIVAGAAWFALSRYNSTTPNTVSEIKSDLGSMYSELDSEISSYDSATPQTTPDTQSEYTDNVSSYNDTVSQNSSTITSSQATAPTGENVSSVPYSTPAFAMPVEGEVIKEFSEKQLQYSATFGDMRLHSGIDIACKKGTAVSSCSDGTVLTVEDDNQYGKTVTIDHGNGITAKYSALEDVKLKAADKVKTGDIIGSTTTIPAECNDKDHLHLEIYKNGIAVSPLQTLGLE